jgi:hypothetical protein
MKYFLLALMLSVFHFGFSQKVNEEKIKFTDTRLPLKPIKTIKSYNFTVVSPYPENNNSAKEFAQKKYQEELANYPNVVAESERKYDDQLKKHEEDVATARENFKIESDAFDKMTLIEKTIVDKVELTEVNTIQVRTATIIERDETEISRSFHRHVVSPGDDVTNEDPKVQAIANAVWTEEVIAAYQALIATNTL